MGKKNLAIVISYCCFSSILHAQNNIKKYVQESMEKVDSINLYTSKYKDLESLENAIGNATIVMLGEQYHGDAAAFLAKTKIIKYLDDVEGFNVRRINQILFIKSSK